MQKSLHWALELLGYSLPPGFSVLVYLSHGPMVAKDWPLIQIINNNVDTWKYAIH